MLLLPCGLPALQFCVSCWEYLECMWSLERGSFGARQTLVLSWFCLALLAVTLRHVTLPKFLLKQYVSQD